MSNYNRWLLENFSFYHVDFNTFLVMLLMHVNVVREILYKGKDQHPKKRKNLVLETKGKTA
jgi:hypothetical protein